MPVFPRASQNITAVAMIMRSVLEPISDEGKRIHKELHGLLEAAAVQQVASSTDRRWPRASAGPSSYGHGAPSRHRVEARALLPKMVWAMSTRSPRHAVAFSTTAMLIRRPTPNVASFVH